MTGRDSDAESYAQLSLSSSARVLIFGVANERSIAWAIAQALHDAGAQIAISYLDARAERRVRPLAESIGAYSGPCNLREESELISHLEASKDALGGPITGLVHSVAFAQRSDLLRPLYEVDEAGLLEAFGASVATFSRLCGAARGLLAPTASVLTLSYLGARRFIPGYSLMGPMKAALEATVRSMAIELGADGIRVNGLSAGPLKTLSSAAIPGLRARLRESAAATALRRPLSSEEVASAALFLLSPLSSGITGEVIHVDCGAHILGPYPIKSK